MRFSKKKIFLFAFLIFGFLIFSRENLSDKKAEKDDDQTLTILPATSPTEEFFEKTDFDEEILKEENFTKNEAKSSFEFSDSEFFEENLESRQKNEEKNDSKNDVSRENSQNSSDKIEIKNVEKVEIETTENKIEIEKKDENVALIRRTFDFVSEEILNRPEVEKFRRQYLNEKRLNNLYSILENSMEYRLFVRKSIQDKELPEILEYLPVVESNYKTNAKSRSGALGMWQFMENSVYPFLVLDDFVDERLDPWKSTEAALKKLAENYNYFKDWQIAIAAYNCGVGAMNKILKKTEKKDFWELIDDGLLPEQTANYVPKLIAVADLAINAEYYKINLPDHKEEFDTLIAERDADFDYVITEKSYSLNQLAQEMRMDGDALKKLNPSYVRGVTYPAKKSEIRLPPGMKKSAEDALKNLIPIDFPFKYTVVAGDSLWAISRKFNVTVRAICDLNNLNENDILRIGKTLYIPAK